MIHFVHMKIRSILTIYMSNNIRDYNEDIELKLSIETVDHFIHNTSNTIIQYVDT